MHGWLDGWNAWMAGMVSQAGLPPSTHSFTFRSELAHLLAHLASCLEGKSLQDKIRPPSYPRRLRLGSTSPHHTWTLVMAL